VCSVITEQRGSRALPLASSVRRSRPSQRGQTPGKDCKKVSKWKCHSGEERIGYEKDEVEVLR